MWTDCCGDGSGGGGEVMEDGVAYQIHSSFGQLVSVCFPFHCESIDRRIGCIDALPARNTCAVKE